MVDQPLGPRVHRVEHFEPALVVGRQEIDELGLQLERLAVCLAPLRLAYRVEQHFDRLRIPALGRPSEVQRGFREMPGLKQRARGLPVQQPPAGGTGGLVDDVANEWVLDLVSNVAGAFLLDHDPRVDQLGEDRTNFFERSTRERRQIAERNRPAHHRDQLEQALWRGIQAAQLRGHAIGQALGQAAEMRSRQIAPFGQERTQQ